MDRLVPQPRFALLEGLDVPRKGLIGPWAHNYADQAQPGPAIGFLQEALRWWDRWLKDSKNGVEQEPRLRAWIEEPFAPGPHDELPGRWVDEPGWPSANTETRRLALSADGRLTPGGVPEAELAIRGLQTAGLDSGWVFSGDQRAEDGRALSFTRPRSTSASRCSAFRASSLWSCPTARSRSPPSASATLHLTASRRSSPAVSSTSRTGTGMRHRGALIPGERARASVRLDAIGRAIPVGHRLRVSVSPTGWPRAWPSPEPVTLTVIAGASHLDLPVRLPRPEDARLVPFAEVEGSKPLAVERLESGQVGPCLSSDRSSGSTELSWRQVHSYRLPDGLEYRDSTANTFSIIEGDPLSANASSEHEIAIARGDWRTRVRAAATLTCDATAFRVETDLAVREDDSSVLAREWSFELPRDHV